MNGYAVHKDCSEGYPKEKGATKTGFSHLNKRMEMEPGMEPEHMIMRGRKWGGEGIIVMLC